MRSPGKCINKYYKQLLSGTNLLVNKRESGGRLNQTVDCQLQVFLSTNILDLFLNKRNKTFCQWFWYLQSFMILNMRYSLLSTVQCIGCIRTSDTHIQTTNRLSVDYTYLVSGMYVSTKSIGKFCFFCLKIDLECW